MSDPSTLEATIERLISDRLADYGLNLADKPALAKTLDPPLLSKLLKEFPDLTSSTELPAKDRETLLQWISGIQELRLISDDFIPVLSRILHNFGDGVLFLNLERLECHMRYIPPPRSKFCPLFLLPHTLQHVDLHINPCAYAEDEGISDQLQLLAKMIKSLPPSLKSLSVTCCQGQSGLLQDAMNSLIHRCRSSLTSFETTRGPPPAPGLIFSSLKKLRLLHSDALPWLGLFVEEKDSLQNDSELETPLKKARDSLETLEISYGSIFIVDSKSLSPILPFKKLVELRVLVACDIVLST